MKKYIFIFITLLITTFSFAQNHSQYISNLEKDAKASIGDENYTLALKKYKKLLKLKPDNEFYNYQYGKCAALSTKNIKSGIHCLEKVKDSPKVNADAYYYLGKLYLDYYKFQKSIAAENKFVEKEKAKEKPDTKKIKYANHYIDQCKNAQNLMKNPVKITFQNLGPNINSSQNDYNPFVPEDESFLIFTSNKSFDSDYGVFVSNIYTSLPTDSGWTFAKPEKKLNTYDNEVLYSISPDGKNVLMGQGLDDAMDIIHVLHRGRSFKPDELNQIFGYVNSKFRETGATITNDKKTIFFSSTREGGKGGSDIYMMKLQPNNEWSKPLNISELNTEYDEVLPNLSADEKKLYFASQGHNSMGGFDIFVSTWNEENNNWGKPVNLGYPINTVKDNMTICFPKDKKHAYISAIRKGGQGGLDIYRITFNDVDERYTILKGTIYVGEATTGKLYQKSDGDIEVSIMDKDDNLYGQYSVNKKGYFIAALPKGNYILKVEIADKNKSYKQKISIKDKNEYVFEKKINIYLK